MAMRMAWSARIEGFCIASLFRVQGDDFTIDRKFLIERLARTLHSA